MDHELARKYEEEDVARFMDQHRIQKEIEPDEAKNESFLGGSFKPEFEFI